MVVLGYGLQRLALTADRQAVRNFTDSLRRAVIGLAMRQAVKMHLNANKTGLELLALIVDVAAPEKLNN